MPIWSEVMSPEEVTRYARRSLEAIEQSKPSLESFLPNAIVNDNNVRFRVGQNGLVDAAHYRAYDAEGHSTVHEGVQHRTVELPALTIKDTISEYDQIRMRGRVQDALAAEVVPSVGRSVDRLVASIVDRAELMRGKMLLTGKATIDQADFKSVDDFGRDADMSVTAGTLWSDSSAKILDDIQAWADLYEEKNGERPGTLVVSRKVANIIARSPQFAPVLSGVAQRQATNADVAAILDNYDLPAIQVYSRKVRENGSAVNVLPDTNVFMLPAAGQSNLGNTYWGRTVASTSDAYGIATADQPGIVAGLWQNERPPMIAEVIADAIMMPVLADANLAFTAKVL